MLYLYESHMGGLYWSENDYSYDALYCDTCSDSDTKLGCASSYEEASNLVRENGEFYTGEHLVETVEEAAKYFERKRTK